MKSTKTALFLAILCCLAVYTGAQTCILASCSGTDCPDGCTGCASATVTQLKEGQTSQLCPRSGSFCFLGTLSNGVCSIQNCDACTSSDPASCTGCKQVNSNNNNNNWCQNSECYSMSYSSVSATTSAPPPTANAASTSSASGVGTGSNCVLSSCNNIDCPNGCANCAKARQVSIPSNGTSVQACPSSASFCFTGAISNNKCTLWNCDGCSSSDPSSCTGCQAITSNNANKDWCQNGNCWHMSYSSSGSSSSSSGTGNGVGTSSSASSGGSDVNTGQNSNCQLLSCNSGDCPNGCENCSKASAVKITDGDTSQLCPANGSFCFIAASTNGVCYISQCTACGGSPSTCTGCEVVTAQNSVSNFCSNSDCFHMGYSAIVDSSSTTTDNNSNSSNGTTVTGNGGITSGSTGGNVNISSITSSALATHVSALLVSVVIGGLVILH